MQDLTAKVYRVFDPDEPLLSANADLYIDLDPVRGDGAVVVRLANHIRRSRSATCQLLAGHRGSGKSTELRRLQKNLEDGSPKMFVVYCEADDDINRYDVDFPDILLAIVKQLAKQLRERAKINLAPGYFQVKWEQLKSLLGSEVTFDSLELEAGIAKITTAIKSDPDVRSQVRKMLAPDTGNLVDAANDVIGKATLELSKKDYAGLVIIVDDLDKMVLRTHETGCSTGEYLFVNREPELRGFMCHTVYTLPLALAYSSQASVLHSLYGAEIPVVPMTKVATRPPTSKPWPAGIASFQQLIDARLKHIEAQSSQVFENDTVRENLIKMSGGQPRELMILVRESFARGDLPISLSGLEFAARNIRRAYAKQLRGEHWPIINQVQKTGNIKRTTENDSLVRELLDSRAILAYVNDADEEWYNLNPIIAELKQPA